MLLFQAYGELLIVRWGIPSTDAWTIGAPKPLGNLGAHPPATQRRALCVLQPGPDASSAVTLPQTRPGVLASRTWSA